MTRITPRTCLWPLTGSLILTFGLSIGVTFRSNHHCFAGTCGEWLFPLQARLHVVVWYCWISFTVGFLGFRAFSPDLRSVLQQHVVRSKIPLLDRHIAISGLLMVIWILSLYGILIGIWWVELLNYFERRGEHGGVKNGNGRLAAIAQTGHLADVTMGMVLLPISRHSALASFFKLSISTTLLFHIIMAYTLFGLVVVHGLLYSSWIPVFNSLSTTFRMVYPVLNPTYLYHETWPGDASSLGIWRASLIFTGLLSTLIMFIVFITTLPTIRQKSFNLFYFTHISTILAVVTTCLHASTITYCVAPGLAMWVLDWGMRIYELREILHGKLTTFGNGWYHISAPIPRRRLDGCACSSPLAHFYIHHSGSSVRELHPFTTITHLASRNRTTPKDEGTLVVQFLFRKSTRSNTPQLTDSKENKKDGFAGSFILIDKIRSTLKGEQKMEWTERLGSLADKDETQHHPSTIPNDPEQNDLTPPAFGDVSRKPSTTEVDLPIRLEGPYFTPANPSCYKTVVCLVAGTGVSGAIAIVEAFRESLHEREHPKCLHRGLAHRKACVPSDERARWERCIIIWTLREADYVDLAFFNESKIPGLEVRIHLTGEGQPRLDIRQTLQEIKGENVASMWVYLSGPNAFLAVGSQACQEIPGIEFYAARWDI